MSILNRIKEAKKNFSEQQNMRAANNLKALKQKREKEEGKARLIKLKNKEKERIAKAREVRLQDVKKKFGLKNPPTTKKKDEKKKGFGEGINPAFGFK